MLVFVSDVHIWGRNDPRIPLLCKFIENVDCEKIFFVGDIFDLFIGYPDNLKNEYIHVIRSLETKAKFSDLVFLEGNHDFHLSFDDTNIKTFQNFSFTYNDKKFFITHGDDFTGEPLHLLFKRFLNSNFVGSVIHSSNGFFISFGRALSALSRKNNMKSSPYGKRRKILKNMISNSIKLFKKGYDFVIMGHCHIPTITRFEIDGREHLFVNPGFWGKSFGTYVTFQNNNFCIQKIRF